MARDEQAGGHPRRGLQLSWVGKELGLALLDAPHHKRYYLAFDARLYRTKTFGRLRRRLFNPLEQEFQFTDLSSPTSRPCWVGGSYTLELGAWGEVTPHGEAY